ncbi:MAG: glycoside hydrolase family 57 protein [Syntrophales bacterium]|nr:glycoside hydrolase family 57 protein [Syntrophales bacterium]
MPSVCLCFQVHQPYRLRNYSFFDIGRSHSYYNEELNRVLLGKVAEKCYLPANRILLDLIRKYRGDFRVSFSITGILLEQMEKYFPKALDSFRLLADTGRAEFLSETYYHSLSFLFSQREFRDQVRMHRNKVKALFGQTPKTFRNTEMIYNNDLAKLVENLGYRTILTEGADQVLGWRSPNYVYQPVGCLKLKCLLKNYRLSDDIAFRFSNREWSEYPLTAEKYAKWVHNINTAGEVVNLFMDYETFGEHQWQESGILDFLKALPCEILKHPDFNFLTPAEAASLYHPVAQLDIPHFISWADAERDLTAWLGNHMQNDAIQTIYGMEVKVRRSRNPQLMDTWRKLQTSDHFYYMCTKWFSDGDVHKYFNPYRSPYDAFINYMNVLTDFSRSVEDAAGA